MEYEVNTNVGLSITTHNFINSEKYSTLIRGAGNYFSKTSNNLKIVLDSLIKCWSEIIAHATTYGHIDLKIFSMVTCLPTLNYNHMWSDMGGWVLENLL